jgi:hypothetical protein
MLPARISVMYCILYPRWTPIYVGGPGSRTWTSEHPHNDRRSYKALRERDISMPAPLQSELPSRGLRCPWIGQQRTSRENEQRETREVVLRQSSVRKTGLQLPINALKHIPTRHQHSQVERHRGAGGQYEPEPPLEHHTPTATVML